MPMPTARPPRLFTACQIDVCNEKGFELRFHSVAHDCIIVKKIKLTETVVILNSRSDEKKAPFSMMVVFRLLCPLLFDLRVARSGRKRLVASV